MFKKSLALFLLLWLSVFNVSFAYDEEIECSSDPVFSEYSCTQCFDWWEKAEWAYISLLSDDWENASGVSKVMYTEQQEMPVMYNLNSEASWSQTPSSEDFWSYTDDFESLYSDEQLGYVLEPGQSVKWIESNLSYAYSLDTNNVAQWENIWLLVYSLLSHNILDSWEVSMNSEPHKECVLYKSWDENEETPVEPETLPQTWPAEFLLLLILAMILGFGIVRYRNS